MASITGALRKLYAKLGGTDTGSQTIAGMIDKVADVAGGGGGGTMVVTIVQQLSQSDFQVDKTFSEVAAHLAADPRNTAVLVHKNVNGVCPLSLTNGGDVPVRIVFSNVFASGGVVGNTFTWDQNNENVVTLTQSFVRTPLVAHMETDASTGKLSIVDAKADDIHSAMSNGSGVTLVQFASPRMRSAQLVYADRTGYTSGFSFTIIYGQEIKVLTASKASDYPTEQ